MRKAAGAIVLAAGLVLTGCGDSSDDAKTDAKKTNASQETSKDANTTGDSQTAPKKTASGKAADTTVMKPVRGYRGGLSTKSVDASGSGIVLANNMIYQHTMTLFDAPSGKRIADIPDTIDLKDFGLSKTSVKLKGGPVEGVWSEDGKYFYASNYVMNGPGYNDEPNDLCTGTEKYKASFVYRINVAQKKIDEVIPVGAVPKYVTLTPDGKKLLVSNWCSYSLGVVDLASKKMEKNIPVARWPRGISASPDGKYAYVAAFGTDKLFRVDLNAGKSEPWVTVGKAARHVTQSPDHKYLYVVASNANTVSKIDRESGKILGQITDLKEPRSMTISPDGKALYVVNYNGMSVTKIRTSDMTRMEAVLTTSGHPIGITYEPITGQIWVANYDGTIDVWDDNATGTPPKTPTNPAAAKDSKPVAP